MAPVYPLSALPAAERAIGRLDTALAEAEARKCHRADALRRAVMANLRLDGETVSEDDLLLLPIVPDAVALGARPAAEHAVALLQLTEALDSGDFLKPCSDYSRPPVSRPAGNHLAAAGLAAALEGLAMLEEGTSTRGDPGWQPIPDQVRLQPWTVHWAEAAFGAWCAGDGQPAHPIGTTANAIAEGIEAVDGILAGTPGLVGASRVILRLHHFDDPPVNREAGNHDRFENPIVGRLRTDSHGKSMTTRFWSTLVRLGAPALIRRACGLEYAHLPIAIALARTPKVFRAMLVAGESEAVDWLLGETNQQATTELERIAADVRLERIRREAMAHHRTDAGALALLDHLWCHPVLTPRSAAALIGCSERAARTAIATLVTAGILRSVSAWSDDHTHASGSSRPIGYKVTGFALGTHQSKPRRRIQAQPPAGTAMSWQPIATAPRDGKRCLVWAGRPTFACFRPLEPDGAPAWRDGRRTIHPTHWLPLAPPD